MGREVALECIAEGAAAVCAADIDLDRARATASASDAAAFVTRSVVPIVADSQPPDKRKRVLVTGATNGIGRAVVVFQLRASATEVSAPS